jgi:ornithine cyclodeaminase/alanine dehydrogenase-like protein (mu-crystallin family)
MSEGLGIEVSAFTEVEDVVRGADIVVTVTPSREALVKKEWISEGVHINAIGADGPGKQELDPHIVAMADKVVVDSLAQCRRIGEIQHALKQNLITEKGVHAEIGQILIGEKSERESDKEITLFDSTGLAAQDIAAAYVVYKEAKEKGLGYTTKLLNT